MDGAPAPEATKMEISVSLPQNSRACPTSGAQERVEEDQRYAEANK
jgi:hypothetical protein